MILRLLRGVMPAAVVALIVLGGCANRSIVTSDGSQVWSGATSFKSKTHAPVTLTLPSGTWKIEHIKPDTVVFEQTLVKHPATFTVVYVSAAENEDPNLALARLLAYFPDRTERSRELRTLSSGENILVAEVELVVDEQPVLGRIAVFRRGKWTIDLVGWNMREETFDALVNSVVFNDE